MRCLHESKRNQQSADGGEVSTACLAASTRGYSGFVPGLLELLISGRAGDQGMLPYRPCVWREPDIALAIWVMSTREMSITPPRVVGGFVRVADAWRGL